MLTTAVSTLIVLVLAHLSVFWVVQTLYPPAPAAAAVPMPVAVETPVYVPPAVIKEPIQHVELPTYEAPKPVAPPSEERKGPPAPESTSIRGDAGVAAPNPQSGG